MISYLLDPIFRLFLPSFSSAFLPFPHFISYLLCCLLSPIFMNIPFLFSLHTKVAQACGNALRTLEGSHKERTPREAEGRRSRFNLFTQTYLFPESRYLSLSCLKI